MNFNFEPMEKLQSKLSVAVFGPSGSGKTTAAIKLAMGIRDELYPNEKLQDIALFIDTERKSSTKAVGRNVGGETLEPLTLYSFEPPYNILELYNLIQYATKQGFKIIVIDSMTAFWSGKDGILENVADLEVALQDKKKMYGAWSEKEIITKKNVLKNLMTNQEAHLIVCFRAKTEYVMEPNTYGKMSPRVVGLKEDMQSDIRYEFDAVLSIDRETHIPEIVKDRIGYTEIKSVEKERTPLTVEDGKLLAKIVSEGIGSDELNQRKVDSYIKFISREKGQASSKVKMFEDKVGIILNEENLRKMPVEKLEQIVNFIK